MPLINMISSTKSYKSLRLVDFVQHIPVESAQKLLDLGNGLGYFERRTGISVYDVDLAQKMARYVPIKHAERVVKELLSKLPPKPVPIVRKPKNMKDRFEVQYDSDHGINSSILDKPFELFDEQGLAKYMIRPDVSHYSFAQAVVLSIVHNRNLEVLIMGRAEYKKGEVSSIPTIPNVRISYYSVDNEDFSQDSSFVYKKEDIDRVTLESGQSGNQIRLARQELKKVSFSLKNPVKKAKGVLDEEVFRAYSFPLEFLLSGVASVTRNGLLIAENFAKQDLRGSRFSESAYKDYLFGEELKRSTRQTLSFFINSKSI